MRICVALRVLVTVLLGARTVEGEELFRLVVDPNGPTPYFDATGRHDIATGNVADIDPGAPVAPGSVVATNVLSPDGAKAALFMGGWLDITTSNPSFASDFLFAANQNLTVTLWFRSAGNGAYEPTPSLGLYADRMHALGFGSATNNLDVDFGDEDPVAVGASETACWTYFGGDGDNQVVDPINNRNYYLDDGWHRYTLVRASGVVTVYLDDHLLGTSAYSDTLGSDSPTAHNYIGRASILTSSVITGDPFPWFGYIAGVRVFDDATGFTSLCDPGIGEVIPCPCSNPPAGSGRGCDNFGAGPVDSGTLTATGAAYLSADTVLLTATGENNTSLTVFWTGKSPPSVTGVPHGAGVRCVTVDLKRMYTHSASGGTVSAPVGADLSVSARTAQVYGTAITAGETRHYFSIYRDPQAATPCGNTSSTINLTNAGSITWNL